MQRRQWFAAAAGALAPLAAVARFRQGLTPVPRLFQLNRYATDAETPLDLLTDYLTPNNLFFVRHHWQPTPVDPAAWRLVVDGEVETPLSLSLAELRRMPQVSVTCVLQCAGNGRGLQNPPVPGIQWQHGAVGNAKWSGVRVRDLLARAGARGTGKHLHSFGADAPPGKVPPFLRSLELAKAMDDAIVAWGMNGEPLLPMHGAPARLVVPGWAGDHWMKWLTRLSVQAEPQHGFYMDTAYRYPRTPGEPGVTFPADQMVPLTELAVKSNFSSVPARVRAGATVTLAGFAFSGAPDITRVEVSADDGTSWSDATLDPRHEPWAWRRWTHRWKAGGPGPAVFRVRATDSRGTTQPRDPVWNQSGYLWNGWHSANVEVVERAVHVTEAAQAPVADLGAAGTPLPDGEGRALAEASCTACHSGDVLRQQHLTERQWAASLTKMKGWGAVVSDADSPRLAAYLLEHFGPGNRDFRPLITRPVRR